MIYLIPVISAFIGWMTNYIAVKMLFHPRKKVRILFFNIQGVFPKRQKKLAEKLGEIVSSELLSGKDIQALITNPNNTTVLTKELENKIDVFIQKKLPEKLPMLGMFLNDSLKNTIKQTLLDEFNDSLPEMLSVFGKNISNQADIKTTVYNKVVSFSTDKLESILYGIMKKEFKFIEILGAILGFIIGLIQIVLIEFI